MTDQYWGEEKARAQAKVAATREMVAQRRAILDALSLDQGERVLEVGSGNGVLAREMLEIVGASGHVCGIDSSGPMVKLAEQICPNGRFIEGDATDLPVEDLSFDAVDGVVSRSWWKLGGAGSEMAWWVGSGGEVKVGG